MEMPQWVHEWVSQEESVNIAQTESLKRHSFLMLVDRFCAEYMQNKEHRSHNYEAITMEILEIIFYRQL